MRDFDEIQAGEIRKASQTQLENQWKQLYPDLYLKELARRRSLPPEPGAAPAGADSATERIVRAGVRAAYRNSLETVGLAIDNAEKYLAGEPLPVESKRKLGSALFRLLEPLASRIAELEQYSESVAGRLDTLEGKRNGT